MNLQKLNPWNWFKHEDSHIARGAQIPVQRNELPGVFPPIHSRQWQHEAHPIRQLHDQIDRMFDDAFSTFGSSLSNAFPTMPGELRTGLAGINRPHLDIAGDDSQYEISLDVPGMSEDELSIEVDGDVLSVKGTKEDKNEHSDKHFYRLERSYGSFQRTLSLPADADSDAISASLNDGVLTLIVPRTESDEDEVKRVAISSPQS